MNWLKKIFTQSDKNKVKLKNTLKKTRDSFFEKLNKILIGKKNINHEILDDLEEILISADVGINTTLKIIKSIENKFKKNQYISDENLNLLIREEVNLLLYQKNIPIEKNIEKHNPYIIIVVGVNGVGKTTTIAKLAYKFKNFGFNVILGAADTFRAAAVDQLEIWAKRIKIPIIKGKIESDPASVVFNTIKYALDKKSNIVLIDTAGRLHNKINLMNELSKIQRITQKLIPDAPHEVLLVLDGSTGQNAFEQTKQFISTVEVSGIVITKLDGTSKAGVIIGISDEFQVPIKYIGTGEKITDIQFFDKSDFIENLFKKV